MRRRFLYLILIGAAVLGSVYRAHLTKMSLLKDVVSIREEWRKHGKPVDVMTLEAGPLIFSEKISGIVLSPTRVEAMIFPHLRQSVSLGQRFSVVTGTEVVSGRVDTIPPSPDLLTGLTPVAVTLTHPLAVPAGVPITARLETGRLPSVIRIPRFLFLEGETQPSVWVIADGRAELRVVRVGRTNGFQAQVTSGLRAGDRIVINGQKDLASGDAVRIRRDLTWEELR